MRGSHGLGELIENGDSSKTADLLEYVFDLYSLQNVTKGRPDLETLQEFISQRLSLFSPAKVEDKEEVADKMEITSTSGSEEPSPVGPSKDKKAESVGRLGPRVVSLNKRGSVGPLVLRDNDLEVESHTNFASVRANVCVFKGKWMYEVTLGTSGIMQLGWAPLECPFTAEEGVGDSPDSFAFDGKRMKRWNVSCQTYGQMWVPGDTIGSCIDLETGQISFYRNGTPLGVAFSNVRFGENAVGLAYFPAVSLSYGERCALNFGSRPFAFPVEGFQPLQEAYNQANLSQANYLLECYKRLLSYMVSGEVVATTTQSFSTAALSSEDALILAASIFERLGPLLCEEYITLVCLYPYLETLIEEGKVEHIAKTVELLLVCLEHHELQVCIPNLLSHLGHKCATTPLGANPGAFSARELALQLLKHPIVLDIFVQSESFAVTLENLFWTKQPNNVDLSQFIPIVWWKDSEEEICSKEKMEESMQSIGAIYQRNEDQVLGLTRLFLGQDVTLPSGKSTMGVFRVWVRGIVEKNKGANRNILPPGLSDNSVITNIHFALLKILGSHFRDYDVTDFPQAAFHSGQLDYYDFSRIGGLLTHLRKNMPIEEPEVPQPIPLEIELVDDLVFLYHLGMTSRFKTAAVCMQNLQQAVAQLDDTNKKIKRLQEQGNEGIEHLSLAKKVFRDDAVENARMCAWYKMILYAPWKQESMFDCVVYIVKLLEHLSTQDPLFSYVPELYLETFVDSFHALRRADPPFQLTEQARAPGLAAVISFFISHFDDKRIINPDLRDLLLQSISVLLQYEEFVRFFERDQIDKRLFIRSMILAFDGRFWIPISTILLRFWRGTGFAQAPKKTSDLSSDVYQAVFREVCSADAGLVNEFLNRIFNQLNWAITEFGVSAKEFQSAMTRHYSMELQQYQRKVTVMFELSTSLIRLIELVSLEVPQAFLGQEMNMTRLSELLLYVLNRTTTGTDASNFENLLKLQLPALEKISRVAILGPVAGTLVNLSSPRNEELREGATATLAKGIASVGGFTAENFTYLLSFEWSKVAPEDPSLGQKFERLKEFIAVLQEVSSTVTQKEESTLKTSESADFCPICCAAIIDSRFVPCGHRSCSRCIKRHLLNNTKCFYCNAVIERVEDENEEKAKSMNAE